MQRLSHTHLLPEDTCCCVLLLQSIVASALLRQRGPELFAQLDDSPRVSCCCPTGCATKQPNYHYCIIWTSSIRVCVSVCCTHYLPQEFMHCEIYKPNQSLGPHHHLARDTCTQWPCLNPLRWCNCAVERLLKWSHGEAKELLEIGNLVLIISILLAFGCSLFLIKRIFF